MPATTTRRRPTPKPAVVEDAEVVDILPAPIEHTVHFERDGDDEPHTFRARPRMTYKRMADVVRAQKGGGGVDAVAIFERMIRPSLCDDDGVPAKWKPEVEDGEFVDPDGDTRPVKDLPDLQALEAGSSRRRWQHLLDVDDDVEIEIEEIVAFYEALVEASSDRPTRKSSSSARR